MNQLFPEHKLRICSTHNNFYYRVSFLEIIYVLDLSWRLRFVGMRFSLLVWFVA